MSAQTHAQHINILVTLNEAYLKHLNVMLFSLLRSNPDCTFTVYLLHTDMREAATAETKRILKSRGELVMLEAGSLGLEEAPTTDRFPKEMYYRIFAAKYLPQTLDRVLYLDPDIVVNASVKELYSMPIDGYYFAAASHNGPVTRTFNGVRLHLERGCPYINSGVLLINLAILREEQSYGDVFSYIEKNRTRLFLPDQDVLSGLYGKRIKKLDTLRYNMTERQYRYQRFRGKKIDLDWVRENTVFIHYCGKNKPWKADYSGKLNCFYNEALNALEREAPRERVLTV